MLAPVSKLLVLNPLGCAFAPADISIAPALVSLLRKRFSPSACTVPVLFRKLMVTLPPVFFTRIPALLIVLPALMPPARLSAPLFVTVPPPKLTLAFIVPLLVRVVLPPMPCAPAVVRSRIPPAAMVTGQFRLALFQETCWLNVSGPAPLSEANSSISVMSKLTFAVLFAVRPLEKIK